MSIILKENEWAQDMIRMNSLGKKPAETLRRVARYYLDSGCSAAETRRQLDTFILRCEPLASLPKWSDSLDRAVAGAQKQAAVDIDEICITRQEIERIDALNGKQIRRLAFTLLCLAKYWMAVAPEKGYWVNAKGSEIMALANINTSIKRQSRMYWELTEAGMLRLPKRVDSIGVQVCFVEPGEPVMHITDFRNLGYQYLMYHGEPYFLCSNCGLVVKYSNPSKKGGQKYCPDCSAKVRLQQSVNCVMRKKYQEMKYTIANAPVFTVYMHECPNQKRYVGITKTTLHHRWRRGDGYKENAPFYSDIQKYGWESIKHYKLASVQDEELAREIESFYIQKYRTGKPQNGYNRVAGRYMNRCNRNLSELYPPSEVDGLGDKMT